MFHSQVPTYVQAFKLSDIRSFEKGHTIIQNFDYESNIRFELFALNLEDNFQIFDSNFHNFQIFNSVPIEIQVWKSAVTNKKQCRFL